MNIQKYLDRIQYTGNTSPDLEVLTNLQTHHLLNIPFENLDIHYGNPIVLDIEKIFTKIVERYRGGFCYELNGLFYELLIGLGFTAKRVSARVFDSGKNSYGAEFDHLAIVVEIDRQAYLTDVGFGDFAFRPLKIEPDIVQVDGAEKFILERYQNEYYRVSGWGPEGWLPEYIFSLPARDLNAFEGMCIYHQTSPNSHFTQKKLISKPSGNGRITLTGDYLKITKRGTTVSQEVVGAEADFLKHLFHYFDISAAQLRPLGDGG